MADNLPHPELQAQREKLRSILQTIPSFGSGIVKPPVIDASFEGSRDEEKPHHETIPGLRALRDAVKRDLDVLDKFLNDPHCASQPALSSNAPYLISVWNEILLAPQPVTGIWHSFSESGKPLMPRRRGQPKEDGVKVDVVADGGKHWIRVNTIKNSRILAEFREIDSYLTESEDEEDEPSSEVPSTLAQTEFDNSVLRMARSLLNAAKTNPIPGSDQVATVTLRLTRLEPSPVDKKEHDPRISRTVEELKSMNVDVRLGERDETEVVEAQEQRLRNKPSPRRLSPSTKINLDLSILIALVSDISHSSLAASAEDAEKRFTPSEKYLSWKRTRLSLYDPKSTADDIARPSRALSNQATQEIVRSLFQEIHDRLSQLQPSVQDTGANSSDPLALEFWTTPEARDRCLKIVSKIGGPNEKRRAQALFPDLPTSLDELEESYWKGSRYPQGFIPLLPIRILPSSSPDGSSVPPTRDQWEKELSPFFSALADACRDLLLQDDIPDPRTLRETTGGTHDGVANGSIKDNEDNEYYAEDSDGEIQRATVMKANPRLTTHTVQSMLWGAVKGWTTFTANKASVKAIIREMKSRRALWDRVQGEAIDHHNAAQPATAALWVVDPRSLAEGMRSDYGTLE